MITGYSPQPLPFINSRNQLSFRQKYCKEQESYKQIVLITDGGNKIRIPHFQVPRNFNNTTPIDFFILEKETSEVLCELPTAGFTIEPLNDPETKQAIMWNTSWVTPIVGTGGPILPDTYYYIELSDGVNRWYSEPFYTNEVASISEDFPTCPGVVRLSWLNTGCIISETYPDAAPEFYMYIAADPSRPTWVYEEDGNKDAEGTFIPTFQRLEKEYELELIAQEHIVDALAAISLFSVVQIYFEDGTYWDIHSTRVEEEWIDGGCTARVKFKFKRTPLVKVGCC